MRTCLSRCSVLGRDLLRGLVAYSRCCCSVFEGNFVLVQLPGQLLASLIPKGTLRVVLYNWDVLFYIEWSCCHAPAVYFARSGLAYQSRTTTRYFFRPSHHEAGHNAEHLLFESHGAATDPRRCSGVSEIGFCQINQGTCARHHFRNMRV